MQMKQMKTGVVYAMHRNGPYYSKNAAAVVVLDPQIWRLDGNRQRGLNRTPNATPGHGTVWNSGETGVPIIKLAGRVGPDALDLLRDTASGVATELATHSDGAQFRPSLPDGVVFQIAQPREIRKLWDVYVAEQASARQAETEARERDMAVKQERGEREEAAYDRVHAVLPEHRVFGRFGLGGVQLSWTDLADLLDAYAEAKNGARV